MTDTKRTILILSDEPRFVDALFHRWAGQYGLLSAASVPRAMEMIGQHRVDLIISDQSVSGSSVVELYDTLAEYEDFVGRILPTGDADLDLMVRAINGGDLGRYLSETWNKEQISGVLLEVFNEKLKQGLRDRRTVESRLVQDAKLVALGELIAGVTHEINNRLGFVQANLGNLFDLVAACDRLNLPEDLRAALNSHKEAVNYDSLKKRIPEMIDCSLDDTERMRTIMEDLKTFTRVDTSNFETIDLHEEINTTLTLLANETKGRIEVVKEYGSLPRVGGLRSRLSQVFMNLLVNACHAIEGDGQIRIATGMEGNRVRIDISDTGQGISEELRQRIFEPFFTTKSEGKGTGLGLAISHGIVKQHRGQLSVESRVGVGTTFTIQVPADLRPEDLETSDALLKEGESHQLLK